MGVAEQRLIKDHQDNTIPKVQKQIAEACGKIIPIDIEWDSFTVDPTSLRWLGTTSGLYVIGDALEAICSDDLGKTAVQNGVKKIAVKNVPEISQEKVAFAEGVVIVHWGWGKADHAFDFSSARVREVVEGGL
jgi:hypothetical protein